jgi:AcrR family transcriptional regulator
MAMARQRGQYAKGVAKRDEILTTALDVIARNGYRRTSVKELADAVGLSQAGLLHYFSSKEELFQEVLRKRDEVDSARLGGPGHFSMDEYAAFIRHNADVPGLVQLYARLSNEATDPEHPAHAYFVERQLLIRSRFADIIRSMQAEGTAPADLDPELTGTLFVAVTDGLQTQWMLDPQLDMADHVAYLWLLVTGQRRG